MAEPDEKFDRFKPAAPKIPGVPEAGQAVAPPAPAPKRPPMALIAGGGAAVLVVLVLVIWWALRPAPKAAPGTPAEAQTAATPAATAPGSPAAQSSEAPLPTAPGEIATLDELAKPWSSKRFYFRKLIGDELVVGIVVRLPSGAPRTPQGYWGFAAGAPKQPCELQVVSDVKRLAEEFGYRASHAMVVNPCNRTVYDPLRLADVAGVWVRGEVVAGPGGRPPLAILIRVEGNSVIASQME